MGGIFKMVFLLILVYLLVSYFKGTTSVIGGLSSGATSVITALQGNGKYAQ